MLRVVEFITKIASDPRNQPVRSFLPRLLSGGMCIKVRKDEVRGQGTVELAKRELL
jgi:hypothetical protein